MEPIPPWKKFHPIQWWKSLSQGERAQYLMLATTIIYSIFSGGQWWEVRKATQITQAAKLVIRDINIGDISSETGFTVTVDVQNIGNREASQIAIVASGAAIGIDNDRPYLDQPDFKANSIFTFVAPGDKWTWTYIPSRRVGTEELKWVTERDGGRWLYVYGVFRYLDGFGHTAYTPFCRRGISPSRHSENGVFKRNADYQNAEGDTPKTPAPTPTSWSFVALGSCPFPYTE